MRHQSIKFAILVLLSGIVTSQAQQVNTDIPVDQWTWDLYKKTFSKTYSTPQEENLRNQVFLNNLKRVADNIAQWNNGAVQYKLKINEFSDMTQEEFQKTHLGLAPSSSVGGNSGTQSKMLLVSSKSA